LSIGIPTLAVVIGILVNNARVTGLSDRLAGLDTHVDDLKETVVSDLRGMQERLR
jgi:hypothetical protein